MGSVCVGVAEDPGPGLDASHIPGFGGFTLHPDFHRHESDGGVAAKVHDLKLTPGLLQERNNIRNTMSAFVMCETVMED